MSNNTDQKVKLKNMRASKLAIEVAARVWTDEETSHIEMNVALAEAFAKRIDRCINILKLAKDAHWMNAPYLEIEKLLSDMESGKI